MATTLKHEREMVVRRLEGLELDGLDSHHNLAAIANAVWGGPPVAWSKEACEALARRLAWLIGGEDG